MKAANSFHHYKGEHLGRAEKIEKMVIEAILKSPLSDEERDSSMVWELMHSSTCKAFMHVLAEKRGLSHEIARVAGAVHDFYVIQTGRYRDHAKLGAPMVRRLLSDSGDFSDTEIELIARMVECHSDKDVYSDEPYVELTKDADVFDCSLYPGTEAYYLAKKPFPVCREYFARMGSVRRELGMPARAAYESLSYLPASRSVAIGDPLRETPALGPVASFVGLSALLDAMPANAGAVSVRCHNGAALWEIHGVELQAEPIPSWETIARLFTGLVTDIADIRSLPARTQLSDLLQHYHTRAGKFWAGALAVDETRKRSAHALGDFACDPAADQALKYLTMRRAEAALGERGMWDRMAKELDPYDAFNGSAHAPPSWDLTASHAAAIDELARLDVIERLRARLAQDLERRMREARPSGARGLPGELVGGEAPDMGDAHRGDWLLLAWPAFGSCEVYSGAEGTERYEKLTQYVASHASEGSQSSNR